MHSSRHVPCLMIPMVAALVCVSHTTGVDAREEDSPGRPKPPPATERLVRDVRGLPVFLYMRNSTEECDTAGLTSVGTVAFGAIRLYQRLISPHLGRRCRFHPTCSEFACQALIEKGLVPGIVLTADRLARDHGFIRAGDYPQDEAGICFDPVEPPCTARHVRVSRWSGDGPMPGTGDGRGRTGE